MDTATIPISALSPSCPSSASIRAVVSLVWPYSSSNKSIALLLAESDFRLRKNRGQVNVIFRDQAAKAVAASQVRIGDEVRLKLEGAKWNEEQDDVVIGGVHTPGKSVGWVLEFRRRVVAQFQRDQASTASVDIDALDSGPEATEDLDVIRVESYLDEQPFTPAPITKPPNLKPALRDSWSSPAFLKHSRLSNGSSQSSAYDPFLAGAEEDGYIPGKGRKRPRVSWGEKSSLWKFVERTPSPEKDDVAAEEEVSEAEPEPVGIDEVTTTGMNLPRTPVSTLGVYQQLAMEDNDSSNDASNSDTSGRRDFDEKESLRVNAHSFQELNLISGLRGRSIRESSVASIIEDAALRTSNAAEYAQATLREDLYMSATEIATEDEQAGTQNGDEDDSHEDSGPYDSEESGSYSSGFEDEEEQGDEAQELEAEYDEDDEYDEDESAEEVHDYRSGALHLQPDARTVIVSQEPPEVIVLSDTEEDEVEDEPDQSESEHELVEAPKIQGPTVTASNIVYSEDDTGTHSESDDLEEVEVVEEELSEEEDEMDDEEDEDEEEEESDDEEDGDGESLDEDSEIDANTDAASGEPEAAPIDLNSTPSNQSITHEGLSAGIPIARSMPPPPPMLRIDPQLMNAPSTPELRPQVNSALPLPSPFPGGADSNFQNYVDRFLPPSSQSGQMFASSVTVESDQQMISLGFEEVNAIPASSDIVQPPLGNTNSASFVQGTESIAFGFDGSVWSSHTTQEPEYAMLDSNAMSGHIETNANFWNAESHHETEENGKVLEQPWDLLEQTIAKQADSDEMQWIRGSPSFDEHYLSADKPYPLPVENTSSHLEEPKDPMPFTDSNAPRKDTSKTQLSGRQLPSTESEVSALPHSVVSERDETNEAPSNTVNDEHELTSPVKSQGHTKQFSGDLGYPVLPKPAQPSPIVDTDAARFTSGIPASISDKEHRNLRSENTKNEPARTGVVTRRMASRDLSTKKSSIEESNVDQDDLSALKQLAASQPMKDGAKSPEDIAYPVLREFDHVANNSDIPLRQQATPDASQQTVLQSPIRQFTKELMTNNLPTPQATQSSVIHPKEQPDELVRSTSPSEAPAVQEPKASELTRKPARTIPETDRKTRSSKQNAAPPAVEEYFTRSRRQSLAAAKEEVISFKSSPTTNRGLRTSLGYYTPLSYLSSYLNNPKKIVDVIASVTKDSKRTQKSKSGAKDWFTSFSIVDTYPYADEIFVQVYRPWRAALPVVQDGDVILLRGFNVKSIKGKPVLIDGEGAAWCSWHFDGTNDKVENASEEVRGPPIEIGHEERKFVEKLRKSWASRGDSEGTEQK